MATSTKFRYAPFFRRVSVGAVVLFLGLAGLAWLTYTTDSALLSLLAALIFFAIGAYWLFALATAPQTVQFTPNQLTLRRWVGTHTLSYAEITAITQSYRFITLHTQTGIVRLHKLFANDNAQLLAAFEHHVPCAQEARRARLAPALPIVLVGKIGTPLFTAAAGIGFIGFGLTVLGEALLTATLEGLDRGLAFFFGVVSVSLGGFWLYQVLWHYPHRTVFTATEMHQHFLTRAISQSMRGVVAFEVGHETQTVRGIARRLYHLTFNYENGTPFKWVPNEFYFPASYLEAVESNHIAELAQQLRHAYLPAGAQIATPE